MKALKHLIPISTNIVYYWLGVTFHYTQQFFAIYKVQFIGKSVNVIQEVLTNKHISKDSLFKALLINAAIIVGSSVLSGFFTFMMRQTIIVASAELNMN